MIERESSERLLSVLTPTLPYIFLLGVVTGFLCLFILGGYDLALRSLYILIPISMASLIMIIMSGWIKDKSINSFSGIKLGQQSFLNLSLLLILLFIVSLILIIGNEKTPLSYYILLGLMTSLVFIQILSCDTENTGRRNIIILEIVFISMNLTLGQTLRLPLYFGYGDILAHLYNIDSIVTTGRVSSELLVDYQYFPGFHIYGAMGQLLSNMDPQQSYFIFNGLLFMISIPIVYLIASRFTRNVFIPLIAALIYSFSLEVVFYSMYMITRVMAFIMCFILLYLLIRGRDNLKMRVGALLLIFPILLIHHTTLFHFSAILLLLIVLELFIFRSKSHIGINFLLFFTIAYLGYWICLSYPFFKDTVLNYIAHPEITRVAVPEADTAWYLTFTDNTGNMIIAFFAVLGIMLMLRARREFDNTLGITFVLFSIVALIVYTPAISGFLSKALLAARLKLLVIPFLAFVAAAGLLFIAGNAPYQQRHISLSTWPKLKSVIKIFAGAFIIFSLAFSSMIIRANYNDLPLPYLLGSENRQYLIDSEIAAFSFADKYSNNFYYSGDYVSSQYLRLRLGLPVDQTSNIFYPASINHGYFVFREYELQSRGQLGFVSWAKAGSGSSDQEYLYQLGDTPDLKSSWEKESRIYDDGSVYIYMTGST